MIGRGILFLLILRALLVSILLRITRRSRRARSSDLTASFAMDRCLLSLYISLRRVMILHILIESTTLFRSLVVTISGVTRSSVWSLLVVFLVAMYRCLCLFVYLLSRLMGRSLVRSSRATLGLTGIGSYFTFLTSLGLTRWMRM